MLVWYPKEPLIERLSKICNPFYKKVAKRREKKYLRFIKKLRKEVKNV